LCVAAPGKTTLNCFLSYLATFGTPIKALFTVDPLFVVFCIISFKKRSLFAMLDTVWQCCFLLRDRLVLPDDKDYGQWRRNQFLDNQSIQQ